MKISYAMEILSFDFNDRFSINLFIHNLLPQWLGISYKDYGFAKRLDFGFVKFWLYTEKENHSFMIEFLWDIAGAIDSVSDFVEQLIKALRSFLQFILDEFGEME